MSIYVLGWIKEDLEQQGKDFKNYRLTDLKELLREYNLKFNR